MRTISHIACVFLSFLSSSALAQAHFSTENEWNSTSIRALGNVGFMSEFHADQFFSDPSLPAVDKRKFLLEFYGTNVSFSKDLVSTFSAFQSLMGNTDQSADGISQTVKILDKIRSVFGKQLEFQLSQTLFGLKVGGFSIIPYAVATSGVEAHVPALPRASLQGDFFGGVGVGYARTFLANQSLSVGLSLRPGIRGFLKGAVDVSSIGDVVNSQANQATSNQDPSSKASALATLGMGVFMPVDLGVGFKPHPRSRINLVIKDIAGASPLSVLEGTAPAKYPMKISLGGMWDAWTHGGNSIRVGTDFQDIVNMFSLQGFLSRWQNAAQYTYHLPFRNQTTVGVNAGLQGGCPSFGVMLDLFIAKFEFSYSTLEQGYYIGQKPSTRYSFRLSSQLSF